MAAGPAGAAGAAGAVTARWVIADIVGVWISLGSAATALSYGAYLIAVVYACNGLVFGVVIWGKLRVRRKWDLDD
jgi:hypothetical protein